MPVRKKQSSEAAVRGIRRRSRRRFSAEEKIRVVLEGLRGEMSVAELCRREGIASNLYYRWSKDFLEAGKKRLNGDTVREATRSHLGDPVFKLEGKAILYVRHLPARYGGTQHSALARHVVHQHDREREGAFDLLRATEIRRNQEPVAESIDK